MSRYPIAVDVDAAGLRAVQWVARGGRLRVGAVHAAALPAGDAARPAALQESLLALRRSGRFAGRRAVLLPPIRSLFTYPLRITPSPGETAEQAAVRDCMKVLPFPPEEALLDFLSVEGADTRGTAGRAVAVAMRKPQLESYQAAFQGAGLELEVVDHHLPALLRLLSWSGANPDGTEMLCWLGGHDSFFAVCDGERLVACRPVEWGIRPLCDRLQSALNVPDAERLLRDFGLGGDGAVRRAGHDLEDVARVVRQLSAPLLEGLVSHLHGMLGYLRSEVPGLSLQALRLHGPGARVRGLPEQLHAELGLSATAPDVETGAWPGLGETPAPGECGLALGLGLRRLSWP